MASPVMLTFIVGVVVRYWLSDSGLAAWLSDRNEVSTPLTSWKRVTEGLSLYRAGLSPYSGDIFHEFGFCFTQIGLLEAGQLNLNDTIFMDDFGAMPVKGLKMPLVLRGLNFLQGYSGRHLYLIFLLCDVLIAYLLDRIAVMYGRILLEKQAKEVSSYHVDAKDLILKGSKIIYSRLYVVVAYLLNPYTIATCLARSTAIFSNLMITLVFFYTLKGRRIRACFFIALATYTSLYPIMLLVPAAIHISQVENRGGRLTDQKSLASMMRTILCGTVMLGGLLYVSYMLEGSASFLQSTYGFILTVPDLTPNMGIFWYFFTEMFDHFRVFFICVFQINAFIYTVPLSIRLRDHSIFLMFSLVALTAIFKSYPSYADAALYLAMLPIWRHTSQYMRNNFVVGCMFLVCTVLAPILWHLWINAGSANANFYFAITLAYSTAQIFLVTDLIYAFLRREYCLLNGPNPPEIDGKPAQIILD